MLGVIWKVAGLDSMSHVFLFLYISSKDVNVYKGRNDRNKAVDTQIFSSIYLGEHENLER